MAYEILLTRLLSVITWYYLALVAVGMAMLGMTAGALAVQLAPDFFDDARFALRLRQGAFAMAIALPVALVAMLAVPLDLSLSAQVLFSFLLFTAFAALPFFFSGIVVCLSLTRPPLAVGKVYLVDLFGAAAGCIGSMAILELLGAPGAILACSALAFVAAAAFSNASGELPLIRRNCIYALVIAIIAAANAATLYGIQPIWVKGKIDRRGHLIAEIWNPISKVKVSGPFNEPYTYMFGASDNAPPVNTPCIVMSIDNFADTPMYQRKPGGPGQFDFLNYDVTSFAYLLRNGGSAAIIGAGGGRDALAAWVNGFTRIVGLEVNGAIVDLDLHRLAWWGGLNDVPGFELLHEEGRSYLTRTAEKFDVIQASMIDTEAATAAGAMTLTENSLYTVEAWRIFFRHLAPGGVLTFSRWAPPGSAQVVETLRIFSLAWDTLLNEGVANPADHVALIRSGDIATLLVRNTPFDEAAVAQIRRIADEKKYQVLYVPGQAPVLPELHEILQAKSSDTLSGLRYLGYLNFSPVHDSSPFFFNFVRPIDLPHVTGAVIGTGISGNVQAVIFLLMFTIASLVLMALAFAIPLSRFAARPMRFDRTVVSGAAYFIAIGLGFMFAEAAFMQQLTLLLGAPAYSLVTVLAGLIFFAGVGSVASDRLKLTARMVPALAAALILLFESGVLLPIVHRFAADAFAARIAIALALVFPSGLAMGGCFPVGLRWLTAMRRDDILPWMWALNGAASVVATAAALLVSMQLSIAATIAFGGICYLVALRAILLSPAQAGMSASPAKQGRMNHGGNIARD